MSGIKFVGILVSIKRAFRLGRPRDGSVQRADDGRGGGLVRVRGDETVVEDAHPGFAGGWIGSEERDGVLLGSEDVASWTTGS